MERILITGASGYVGAYLCRKLSMRKTSIVTAIYNNKPGNFPNIRYEKCDLSNLQLLKRIFSLAKPDIIYHLASVTPTRIGDKGNDYVEFINHFVTGHIARLAAEYEALLIYPSTDLVYKEGHNITEESILDPKSVYAESKLNGEEVIESFAPKFVILRMSLVYGLTINSYESFFDHAYKCLRDGKKVNAFIDQYRHPIYVKDAVYNFLKIPEVYDFNLILNLCGDEYLSRYEMCVKMADAYSLDSGLIKQASCDDLKSPDCVKQLGMNNQKMHFYGLTTMPYDINLQRSLDFRY